MKILSPAGNFESLKMAVFNGADEVYLGINDFNARNNIDGFDLNSLKQAVEFAHVFGVKVDLAINILFSNNEIQSALDTIIDAYNLGVDAFIIQDLGLAQLVHKNYPQIELHASTQMGIHNLEGVKEIEKYGFKRVVLARETPLEEIKRIRDNSNIEIEYFAQGALCVSFSGNCYLSSKHCGASGNRGKCKQLCRLPYTFLKNGKPIKTGYLLSAKDFNMISRLNDLKQAGVDVLKIEGRARRPFYVAMATREYYNALHGKSYNNDNLKLAFNRQYTAGYFDGNGNIISNIQNHIGIEIGKVEKVICGKKFNEIFISSNRILYPKSTFKFISNGIEKCSLSAFDIKSVGAGKYRLTTTQNVEKGDQVHLIMDKNLEDEALSFVRKKEVSISIYAKQNMPIKAAFSFNNEIYEIEGDTCETALKQPISIEELKENFSKSELFSASIQTIELENVFMPKQKLNEFRRKVFEKIYEVVTSFFKHNLEKIQINLNCEIQKFSDFQVIEDLNEKLVGKNIIYSPEIYSVKNVSSFKDLCEKNDKHAYLDLPNFALQKDISLLKEIVEKTKIDIVANNYYALSFNANKIIGAGLNVYNNVTAQTFDLPVITAESDISNQIDYPLMTLRHCPLKSHLNANCSNCPFSNDYTYKMDNGKILKLKRKKLFSCTFYLCD